MTALTGFDGHQGIALVVAPRRYASVADILARATERGEPPFVLILDSLEDPQNVGTLLRSAEAAGAHGVIFPTRRQAPLSPAAVKASAGAVEHLLLAPVDDLAGALAGLHVAGLRVVGAEAEAPLTMREADLRGPIALVVGSEGQGLGPAVRKRCDLMVRIPMRGAIGSLNASVAGSILLFEAATQRGDAPPRRAPKAKAPAAEAQPAAPDPAPAPEAVSASDVPATPEVPATPDAEVAAETTAVAPAKRPRTIKAEAKLKAPKSAKPDKAAVKAVKSEAKAEKGEAKAVRSEAKAGAKGRKNAASDPEASDPEASDPEASDPGADLLP